MNEEQFRKQVSENEDTAIKLLKENVKLKSIIKEVREYVEKHIRADAEYPYYMEMLSEDYYELLEILDKGNK